MTQEEAKRILKIYLQAISFQYPGSIAEAIRTLCEPLPLPSDLDEAAFSYENDLWESGFKECGYSPQEVSDAFKAGAQYAAPRWINVDEKLPEMDEEVIVLTDELGTAPIYKIAFGHIVDVERCIDYNGWNIPGVKYWMPCPEIPKKD